MRRTRVRGWHLRRAQGSLLGATAGAQAVTLSPLNGTPDASPHTQISFLGAPAGQIAGVSVKGSRSGSHRGKLRSYASAAGASFLPARGFTEGERVTVRGPWSACAVTPRRVSTTFTIARLVNYPLPAGAHRTPPAKPGANQSFVSQPTLQPPTVAGHGQLAGRAPGDIFLTAEPRARAERAR